jgi:lysophospholipase L1-like esterase
MRTFIAAVLCATLAACGGGGSSGGSSPAAAPVSQAPKCTPLAVVKIQLFGDSTQWGKDGETQMQSVNNPTAVLQRLMDARFGPGAVTVEDRAVSGTTSGELLNGTDGLNKPWPGSVNADITVVNHGINDLFQKVPLETYKSNLRQINVTVYETQSPLADPRSPLGYPDAMRAVAAERGAPVADVDAYVRALPNWQAYLADGIHPNATLYGLIVTNALFPTLDPLVAKLKCQ